MSKMKRLASVLLALVMVFALSTAALAVTSYTITISNDEDGYVYTAYQIFEGDLSGTGTQADPYVLTNVDWGSGVDPTDTDFQAALLAAYGTYDAATIADEQLTTQARAEAFADIVGKYLVAANGVDSTDAGSTYTIEVSEPGYYLIKNTAVPMTGTDITYTNYIMQVVADVTVSPKAAAPSSDKTVSDINDSDDTTYTTGQTSADHDIGDDVPFTLTATLPTNYGAYETYQLNFHDVMDDGLTFNDDVVVSVGGVVVDPSCYTVVYTGQPLTDGCTFEVLIEDTHDLVDEYGDPIHVAGSSVVTVSYTAELNENAVIGNPGNENTSWITYSNNPTWDGDGTEPTGDTPPETVVVFTYELIVNKVDESGDPLTGAGFTLYKFDEDVGDYVAVGAELTGTSMTTFTWTGLDDGEYMLVETTTPASYNTMDNLYFTVTAVHNETTGITSLTITDAQGELFQGNLTFIADADTGEIETDIENGAGSALPGTGGVGTTIFYIVGGLMVFGAAVLLITRKRMGKAE
ncbi:MAG: isopeptide-forming domain-containing fimbrial protein [Oscillospiraceae bacterium]|nr:isopeptide-forming domain-containing fimbrial protein [Oscillospiraceae bacterium]